MSVRWSLLKSLTPRAAARLAQYIAAGRSLQRETLGWAGRFAQPSARRSRVIRTDVCVIFNPTAGRGRALGRVEALRRILGSRAEFQATQGPGHGEELALQAAQ